MKRMMVTAQKKRVACMTRSSSRSLVDLILQVSLVALVGFLVPAGQMLRFLSHCMLQMLQGLKRPFFLVTSLFLFFAQLPLAAYYQESLASQGEYQRGIQEKVAALNNLLEKVENFDQLNRDNNQNLKNAYDAIHDNFNTVTELKDAIKAYKDEVLKVCNPSSSSEKNLSRAAKEVNIYSLFSYNDPRLATIQRNLNTFAKDVYDKINDLIAGTLFKKISGYDGSGNYDPANYDQVQVDEFLKEMKKFASFAGSIAGTVIPTHQLSGNKALDNISKMGVRVFRLQKVIKSGDDDAFRDLIAKAEGERDTAGRNENFGGSSSGSGSGFTPQPGDWDYDSPSGSGCLAKANKEDILTKLSAIELPGGDAAGVPGARLSTTSSVEILDPSAKDFFKNSWWSNPSDLKDFLKSKIDNKNNEVKNKIKEVRDELVSLYPNSTYSTELTQNGIHYLEYLLPDDLFPAKPQEPTSNFRILKSNNIIQVATVAPVSYDEFTKWKVDDAAIQALSASDPKIANIKYAIYDVKSWVEDKYFDGYVSRDKRKKELEDSFIALSSKKDLSVEFDKIIPNTNLYYTLVSFNNANQQVDIKEVDVLSKFDNGDDSTLYNQLIQLKKISQELKDVSFDVTELEKVITKAEEKVAIKKIENYVNTKSELKKILSFDAHAKKFTFNKSNLGNDLKSLVDVKSSLQDVLNLVSQDQDIIKAQREVDNAINMLGKVQLTKELKEQIAKELSSYINSDGNEMLWCHLDDMMNFLFVLNGDLGDLEDSYKDFDREDQLSVIDQCEKSLQKYAGIKDGAIEIKENIRVLKDRLIILTEPEAVISSSNEFNQKVELLVKLGIITNRDGLKYSSAHDFIKKLSSYSQWKIDKQAFSKVQIQAPVVLAALEALENALPQADTSASSRRKELLNGTEAIKTWLFIKDDIIKKYDEKCKKDSDLYDAVTGFADLNKIIKNNKNDPALIENIQKNLENINKVNDEKQIVEIINFLQESGPKISSILGLDLVDIQEQEDYEKMKNDLVDKSHVATNVRKINDWKLADGDDVLVTCIKDLLHEILNDDLQDAYSDYFDKKLELNALPYKMIENETNDKAIEIIENIQKKIKSFDIDTSNYDQKNVAVIWNNFKTEKKRAEDKLLNKTVSVDTLIGSHVFLKDIAELIKYAVIDAQSNGQLKAQDITGALQVAQGASVTAVLNTTDLKSPITSQAECEALFKFLKYMADAADKFKDTLTAFDVLFNYLDSIIKATYPETLPSDFIGSIQKTGGDSLVTLVDKAIVVICKSLPQTYSFDNFVNFIKKFDQVVTDVYSKASFVKKEIVNLYSLANAGSFTLDDLKNDLNVHSITSQQELDKLTKFIGSITKNRLFGDYLKKNLKVNQTIFDKLITNILVFNKLLTSNDEAIFELLEDLYKVSSPAGDFKVGVIVANIKVNKFYLFSPAVWNLVKGDNTGLASAITSLSDNEIIENIKVHIKAIDETSKKTDGTTDWPVIERWELVKEIFDCVNDIHTNNKRQNIVSILENAIKNNKNLENLIKQLVNKDDPATNFSFILDSSPLNIDVSFDLFKSALAGVTSNNLYQIIQQAFINKGKSLSSTNKTADEYYNEIKDLLDKQGVSEREAEDFILAAVESDSTLKVTIEKYRTESIGDQSKTMFNSISQTEKIAIDPLIKTYTSSLTSPHRYENIIKTQNLSVDELAKFKSEEAVELLKQINQLIIKASIDSTVYSGLKSKFVGYLNFSDTNNNFNILLKRLLNNTDLDREDCNFYYLVMMMDDAKKKELTDNINKLVNSTNMNNESYLVLNRALEVNKQKISDLLNLPLTEEKIQKLAQYGIDFDELFSDPKDTWFVKNLGSLFYDQLLKNKWESFFISLAKDQAIQVDEDQINPIAKWLLSTNVLNEIKKSIDAIPDADKGVSYDEIKGALDNL